ncbi:MAG TPA: methyl-accepting chemotaxis protein [Phenylobacterium sp.]|jgi:methyl-accepting chemotaxis protein|uniref:methyl-accepting chemotaxis protein n=1 Tax=Phenylobacterium sp. TaxID=1871053 RepID=UPI002D2C8A10|nr:methyl-accepting chemotaxis protein [Phenylobacterium sp.]HZZ69420.1 methyl-accepting chemotaxis protein [Phenylobacterium sp.]
MPLNDLKISKKLAIGFACVVTIVTVMSAALFFSLTSIRHTVTDNDAEVAQVNLAHDVDLQLIERMNGVRGFAITGDPSFLKAVDGAKAKYETSMDAWIKAAPEDKAATAAIKAEMDSIFVDQDEQVSLSKDPATKPLALEKLGKKGRLNKIRSLLKAYNDQEAKRLKHDADAQEKSQSFATTTLVAGASLSVLLSALMGWLLSRAIAGPISKMTEAMGRLASGDHAVDVPAVGRRDEVGQMADAVQTFKDAAIEKVRLEAEAAAQRREVEEQRKAAEAERAATAQQQSQVVDGLAQGLERLAGGVLTFRLNEAFAPSYEKLRADFNAAMEQMQRTIAEVATNSSGVRTASTEISQASDNLSRRTEQQAASLEETAAALDEITATVRKTAEGAGQARDAVGLARADAERSGIVVRDAVAAMAEIENSAQQISQIIGVIDEIAFQTNLLALNAGVEAARAGDAGRGFAVVASEVRALAQRSADAAKEIKALISASSQQVDRGVNLVGETGKVLERIVTQVTQINGVVTEIAASAEEQSTGLQQVNTAVNQMDQVTQQNAAMVEEATAASHALTSEADTLARLISRFELGAEAKAAAQASHAPAPQHRPVAQMKTTGARGGAAPAFATHEDSWDEF